MRLTPVALAVVLVTSSLFAIPQNFNQGGGFFLNTGVSFENFAADNATWAPGATLIGRWSTPDGAGAQTLKDDAVVFGVPAAEIIAQRVDYRVTKLRVFFREKERKPRPLLDRLTANIRAATGDAGKDAGKGARIFRHARVQIIARGISPGEVVLEFTPLA